MLLRSKPGAWPTRGGQLDDPPTTRTNRVSHERITSESEVWQRVWVQTSETSLSGGVRQQCCPSSSRCVCHGIRRIEERSAGTL
eukprot:3736772-Rhodomonas_salina.3